MAEQFFDPTDNANLFMGKEGELDTPVDQMYFEQGADCCTGECEKFQSPQQQQGSGDFATKEELNALALLLKNKANLTDKGKHVEAEYVDGILIDENIPVIGQDIGSFKNGDVVQKDTSFEAFVKLLLQKRVNPSYKSPYLQITSNGNSYEIGTTVTAVIDLNYIPNDGGSPLSYSIYKDGTEISLGLNKQYTETFTLSQNVAFDGKVHHAAGVVKNDTMNEPCPTGAIAEGDIHSERITIVPYRNGFYGCAADANTPLDNTTLRRSSAVKNPTLGSSFSINIPTYTKLVYFAIPAGITNDIKSVIYKEAGNVDVKISFKKTTVLVYGANSKYPIDYDVYFYIADSYFSTSATYTVNI